MSTEDNKALTRRAYEALNQRNWAAFGELVSPDFVLHYASRTIQGLEAYKQFLSMYQAAFPDASVTIDELIADGDTVAVRQTFRGTHTGDLMGIPPTGKQASGTGVQITHIRNGKASEQWFNGDDLGLLEQLGVVPATLGVIPAIVDGPDSGSTSIGPSS
jgi:steroid delta-isomerase-like uncharacterized protein